MRGGRGNRRPGSVPRHRHAGRPSAGAARSTGSSARTWPLLSAIVVIALATVLASGYLIVARPLTIQPATRPTATAPTRSPSPSPPPAVLAALSAAAPAPTAAGLARALAGPLADPSLGSLAYEVADGMTGQQLAGQGQTSPRIAASVTKLATITAALGVLGPLHRITTKVVAGAAPGTVVLVGAGDPTLSVGARQAYPGAGRLDLLAAQVRTALAAAHAPPVTRVVVDGSAYTGPDRGPGWDSGLVAAGYVAPITAVMVDGGRTSPTGTARTDAPDLFAGQAFARLLGAPGAAVVRGTAPAGASTLGQVRSAPLTTIVEQCLATSDNVLAEALARLVAGKLGEPASFTGAVAAVKAELARLGVPVAGDQQQDGSGLSRLGRMSPQVLAGILVVAASAAHPDLRALLAALPVAGYSGTLDERFRGSATSPAAGEVRAKTGTLSGVSSLAGLTVDADGRLLVFALISDGGDTFAARAALDRIAARLAACGCR